MREELLLHRLKLMLAVIIAMMLCGALLTTAGVEWGVIAGIAGLAAALPVLFEMLRCGAETSVSAPPDLILSFSRTAFLKPACIF